MAYRVIGKVVRLNVAAGAVYIRLDNNWKQEGPKDGYFELKTDHPNYKSLYSLALAAAINRLPLNIRMDTNPPNPSGITTDEWAPVSYMVIDW